MSRRSFRTALCLLLLCTTADRLARGQVVRMEVLQQMTFADGHALGHAGPYEIVRGRMQLAVDPDAEANAIIRDLQRAPQNEQGKVDAWTDFFLLKPVDPSRGNR